MKKERQMAKCPLQHVMLLLGDKWSLLIIRDVMFCGITSHSEFLEKEKIASNILQSKLNKLTENGFLNRRGALSNKTKVLYTVTDDAIDLLPVIMELIAWGMKRVPNEEFLPMVKRYRESPQEFVKQTRTKIIDRRALTYQQMLS